MSLLPEPLLHAETITIVRREETGRDDYGLPIVEEVERDVPGCNVQPLRGETTEVRATGTELVTARMFVSAPLNVDIDVEDRVRYRGADYELYGAPQQAHTGLGLLDHTELVMVRYRG